MQVNGKTLAVEVLGEGDAVLMVHGLGGTANTWHAQRSVLAQSFRVICPDLEGSGRSPLDGTLSIASFVADMVGVLDALGIASVHAVGHSMGTIICQHLAAAHASRIRSLALLGPLAEPPPAARTALAERAQLARSEGMVPIADALVQASLSVESRVANPAVAAFVREILMRQPAEGYARTCEALAAATAARSDAIRCPTVLITGDEDRVGPPRATARLSRAIAGSRAVILPATGHWTPIERPAEVNRALLDFYFTAHGFE
ncbi:alpha/beta fold hydrolase [Vineibacter terrae]|nr:alpha/beta hydrolase [Vineibacter terrae]